MLRVTFVWSLLNRSTPSMRAPTKCAWCGAYVHSLFRSFVCSSRCVLFDEEEIRRFDQAMEHGEFRELFVRRNGVPFDPNNAAHRGGGNGPGRQQRQQPYQRGRGCFCPNCRYLNPRTGPNNHVTCINCRVKFCMQCSARVRNAAQHYRAGARCKQHNAE